MSRVLHRDAPANHLRGSSGAFGCSACERDAYGDQSHWEHLPLGRAAADKHERRVPFGRRSMTFFRCSTSMLRTKFANHAHHQHVVDLDLIHQPRPTAFRTKLESLLVQDDLQQEWALLIDFVFPKDGEPTAPPQGLSGRGRNYWERFQSIPALADADRDQPLLKHLRELEEGGALQLANYIAEGGDERPLEVFAASLDAGALMTLLASVTDELLKLGTPIDEDGHPRGVTAIWRLLRDARGRGFDVRAARHTLVELTSKCLPEHLFLAQQLVYWFGPTDEPRYQVLPQEEAEALMLNFHAQLRLTLGDAASTREGRRKLLAGLRSGREVALLQAVWGVPALRAEQHLRETPFEGWGFVRDSLLAAAEEAPNIVLGPLAWFVTVEERDNGSHRDQIIFTRDVAERLFGEARLLALYAKSDVREFQSTDTRDRYNCVKKAASALSA